MVARARGAPRAVRRLLRATATAAVLLLPATGCSLTPGAGATASSTPSPTATAPTPAAAPPTADEEFGELEDAYQARLGVYAVDTGTGRELTYRADERFAFASTVKALAAGALLQQLSDAELDATVEYDTADLVPHSPVTERHVVTNLPWRTVLAAALQQSENTAANLMFARLGGPAGLQQALRALGDRVTRSDRVEPALNSAVPGDVRDTTTARAIAHDLRELLLGDALQADRRALLRAWMTTNTTGGPYVRAGLPAGWEAADKTGSGGHGTRNDIAVVWPPGGGAPYVIALMSDRGVEGARSEDRLLADATRVALETLR
ncbi:class A beta-lactamase [Motilibacter sp. E257]|uniref:Beta-lactamase n=1 Tax=Motilibacter deserti TaxID=2714956 RepID=A0ABX0GNT9_9ACTN|nr:class A beta-lactamase [Motilibacter deserti]